MKSLPILLLALLAFGGCSGKGVTGLDDEARPNYRATADATAIMEEGTPPTANPMASDTPRTATASALATSIPTTVGPSVTTPGSAASEAIQVLSVQIAVDGAMVIVNFKAPVRVARSWAQGSVFVVDEATGDVYANIPTLPAVGPLFARPKQDGQVGYVMLANVPGLGPGAVVTVVLGEFKKEHVVVSW